MLLDLRRRVFVHFQRLSLSFHERYTSGRVISRQTSDVEAIGRCSRTASSPWSRRCCSIVGIGIALLLLDLQLALAVLATFPVLWFLTRWFRSHSERAYRATRDAVALVIVHFVESLGGIQAVHAFRREPRNQEIFEHLDDRYRDANIWSQRLAAVYGPGVQLVGRMTTAVVLLYGGWLVLDGQMSVGVLAAFLLYLRRFFEPMQELSQFYNLFQAAAAGLEKLSGVLDEPPTRARARAPGAARGRRAARCASTASSSPTASARCSRISTSTSRRARRSRSSARPARARRRSPAWRPASGTRPSAACCSTASTCATSTEADLRARGRHGDPGELPVHRLGRRQHRARPPGRGPRARSRPRHAPSARTSSSPRCPTATTPTSTRRARGSRPGSASWSRSPARSSPTPRC